MFALTLAGGLCMSTTPDVCKTPAPPAGPVPVPYVNIFQCNMITPNTACDKVLVCGAPSLTVDSKTSLSNGNEPGVSGGVVSSKFIGEGAFLRGSMKVKFGGKAVVSQGANTKHNKANTVGMNQMAAQTKVMVS